MTGALSNYYSNTEDVLRNGNENNLPKPSVGLKWELPIVDVQIASALREGAWIRQELAKGGLLMDILGVFGCNSQGGWGFNDSETNGWCDSYTDMDNNTKYWLIRPGDATLSRIPTEQLKTKPFFRWFDDHIVFDPVRGSAEVDPSTPDGHRLQSTLLAEAIPALSFVTGGNPVAAFKDSNINMTGLRSNGWPKERNDGSNNLLKDRWLHSDAWSVAYPYVYRLYDNIKDKIN